MQKITPHLWFDREAKEAAEFYTSHFPGSKVTNITTLRNTPSGDADIVSFELAGLPFMAISAGPLFRFNPSISFIVNFDPSRDKEARKNIDGLWAALSEGGTALMPLDEYPFSKRFGWIQDKFGLSWQLILSNPQGEERPFIVPALMFVRELAGRAEQAINFYLSVFRDSRTGAITRFGPGQEPDREGTVMFADFMIENRWFAATDSAHEHNFAFNESISFVVHCQDQKEIDYYWDRLSAVPEAEQCGWLKDRFGVSWQIVPLAMDEMMAKGTPAQIDRVTQTFLPMKKLIVADLEKAFEGK